MTRLKPRTSLRVLAVAVAAASANVYAQADAEARFRNIEQLVQQLQQERVAQDRRIDMLVSELNAVRSELAEEKASNAAQSGGQAAAQLDEQVAVQPTKSVADQPPKLSAVTGKQVGLPVYASTKDGLVFEDSSGDWKLQINGRVQTDFRAYAPSQWNDDTFSIRRARFGGTFTFLQDFAVRVEGEYANDNTGSGGTTSLTYGYLDYSHYPEAMIRVGQFKPFFGLERAYSTNFLDFTELSLATNNGSIFNSTYDRGVMLYGNPEPWVNYNVYVVNGTGQNTDDTNDGKDYGARLNANFASLVGMQDTVIHAGASASTGNVGKNALTQTTEAVGITFFNVQDVDPDTDRERLGVESAFAFGPVKLQAEYFDANFNGVQNATTDFNNDITAWYADLNWLVTGESYASSYKSGVFGSIQPKHNFTPDGGWGALELGLRFSDFDASAFQNLLASEVQNASEATAWTAGAKWILNPNARLLLNYVYTDFAHPGTLTINDKSDDSEKAIVVRAQYDY